MSEIETQAREETLQAEIGYAGPPRRRGWLARLRPARPQDAIVDPVAPARRRPSGYLVSFIALVALPALAASFYFAFLASDEYVAESRFAVHSMAAETVTSTAQSKKATTSGSLMAGFSAASDDAYLVAAYVRSRACIDEVSKSVDLKAIFRRPEADFVSRLKRDPSPEAMVDYWQRMVTSYVDPPSGIVTVKASAFRREDALEVSQAILVAAEKMANAISARARADIIKLADAEVASAEERVAGSLKEMRDFREKAGFIDPKMQAEALTQTLETLIQQRIRLQTDIEVSSRAMSPEAPTLQSLKGRLDQLDLQIAAEKAKLTSRSTDPAALANLLPDYESLLVRNTFAEKLYGLAADGLERARLRAEAQTIYIDVFVPPAIPQEALYPERFASSVLIAIGLLVVWGIGALTAAIVEDHKALSLDFNPQRLEAGLGERLAAQGRILLALMIRDVQTRFFGHALGFVVAVAWPVSHIFILLAINSAVGRQTPYGDDPALFYATGLLPFMCFNYMSRFTMLGVVQNKPLLNYPRVKVADMLIARAVVEVLNAGVVILVTIVILTAMGVDVIPPRPNEAMSALLACMGLGLGVGLFNGVIAGIFPFWITAFALLQIIIWIASGVILVPDDLPEGARWWLSWNPALIGVEWMRSAFYDGYGLGDLLDKRYMLGFVCGSIFLGLVLERGVRGVVLR